jgi:hypothetical protein
LSRIVRNPAVATSLLALAFLAASGCAPSSGRFDATAAGAGAEVRLVPNPAFAGARLAVVFAGPEPDPASRRIEWRRNGAEIEGASTTTLEPSRFSRGDLVSVHVYVPLPGGSGARERTAAVKVLNSAPRIASIGIVLEPAAAGHELRANVECLDADGDVPRLEYSWAANGEPLEDARGPSLPVSVLARGDRVTLSVVARDGELESPPAASAPFVLENHSPAFESQPVAPRAGDAVFEYRAVARDPDGDALRYSLALGPDGMTVGPQGDVRWELPAGEARRGEFPVRLRASDPHGGEAVQEFTIRL